MADYYGDDLNNRFSGTAPSSDRFFGELGDDVYAFDLLSGSDIVSDDGGTADAIELDASVAATSVRVSCLGSDLIIRLVDESDDVQSTIRVKDHFSGATVETLRFGDGTSIDLRGGLTIQGALGVTDVTGTDFDDTVISSDRRERFFGGLGDDVYAFDVVSGADAIIDGGGTGDAIRLDASVGPNGVRLTRAGTDLQLRLVDDFDQVRSTITVKGHFSGATVETLRLDDGTVLDLRGGLTIQGAQGVTSLLGTDFDDVVISSDRGERLYGGLGDDLYRFGQGWGSDTISDTQGRTGIEITGVGAGDLSLARSGSGVVINELSGGSVVSSVAFRGLDATDYLKVGAKVWQIVDLLDGWTGTRGDDIYVGGPGAQLLQGLAGNDRLTDRFGDNTLDGDGGRDVLRSGTGSDTLYGDAGADLLQSGAGADRLEGGNGRDRLFGGADRDVLAGGAGSDRLAGQGGNDVLQGDGGRDRLIGGLGADRLTGGQGNDMLIGSAGRDRFVFQGRFGDDTVTDWSDADVLVIARSLPGVDSKRSVIDAAEQVGNDLVLSFGASSITLRDSDLSDLTARDIVLF